MRAESKPTPIVLKTKTSFSEKVLSEEIQVNGEKVNANVVGLVVTEDKKTTLLDTIYTAAENGADIFIKERVGNGYVPLNSNNFLRRGAHLESFLSKDDDFTRELKTALQFKVWVDAQKKRSVVITDELIKENKGKHFPGLTDERKKQFLASLEAKSEVKPEAKPKAAPAPKKPTVAVDQNKSIFERIQQGEGVLSNEWMGTDDLGVFCSNFSQVPADIDTPKIIFGCQLNIHAGSRERHKRPADAAQAIAGKVTEYDRNNKKKENAEFHFSVHDGSHFTRLIVRVDYQKKTFTITNPDSLKGHADKSIPGIAEIKAALQKLQIFDASSPAAATAKVIGGIVSSEKAEKNHVVQTNGNDCGVVVAADLFKTFGSEEEKTLFSGLLALADANGDATSKQIAAARLDIAKRVVYLSFIEKEMSDCRKKEPSLSEGDARVRVLSALEDADSAEVLGLITAIGNIEIVIGADKANELQLPEGSICDVEKRKAFLAKTSDTESSDSTPTITTNKDRYYDGLSPDKKKTNILTAFDKTLLIRREKHSIEFDGLKPEDIVFSKDKKTTTIRIHAKVTDAMSGQETGKEVTLTRTAIDDAGTIEWRCVGLDWKEQCELIARQAIEMRKAEAHPHPPETSVALGAISDFSPRKKCKIGDQEVDLTEKEKILIETHLAAGTFTLVQFTVQGKAVTFRSGAALTHAPVSPVVTSKAPAKGPLFKVQAKEVVSPSSASSTGGVFVGATLERSDDHQAQAKEILDYVWKLKEAGWKTVGITYSANQKQTDDILTAYAEGKTLTDVSGSGQAAVMSAVESLLKTKEYKELQNVFRIVPITTMKYVKTGTGKDVAAAADATDTGDIVLADDASVNTCLENLEGHLKKPDTIVIGLKETLDGKERFAAGSMDEKTGVAYGAMKDRGCLDDYKKQNEKIQTALTKHENEHPMSVPFAAAPTL